MSKDVITFGIPLGHGGRISQFSHGEYTVQVYGIGAESTEGARALATEMLSMLRAAQPIAVVEDRADKIARVAAEVSTRGVCLGARFSVGRHTPATPSPFAFCVLNLQGSPVFLAHDAFEAARWFVLAEDGEIADIGSPIALDSDAELAETARQERLVEWRWLFDQLSNPPPPPERRLRAPGERGYDKRCEHCADAAPHTMKEHMKSVVAALRNGAAA